MACFTDDDVEKDWDVWKEDGWYKSICNNNFRADFCSSYVEPTATRMQCIFCLCFVDKSKWSWKSIHHTIMAVCSFLLVLLAIISFASFAQIQQQGLYAASELDSGSCILFASYKGDYIELNTETQSCNFGIGGEVLIFLFALLLVGWFWAKARFGTGGKLDSVWLNVLQLLVLVLLLILGFSCASIINAGLNHTCRSHVPSTDFQWAEYDTPGSGEVVIQSPCDNLYFETGPFSEHVAFYHNIRVAEIAAWLVASLLLAMSVATIASFILYHCRHQVNPPNW